jgi:amyloid beta precursor protein binding protein 1
MDSGEVCESDLISNFFLMKEDLGKSKSECAFHWLSELNPSVKCSFEERNLEQMIDQNPNFFKEFSLILVSRILKENLDGLKNIVYKETIPIIQV